MRAALAALAALALPLLAAQAALAEGRSLTGSVAYRERIALAPGAELAIEVRDASGAIVAEARTEAGDAQVPLPFSLEAPEGALTLRAALVAGGRPLWVGGPVPVAEGTAATDLGTVALTRVAALDFPVVWRCADDIRFAVSPAGEGLRLRHGGSFADLLPVAAASGAKYEAAGDPATWAWSKGNRMSFAMAGATHADCVLAIDGSTAAFVARGNEPGWRLTIDNGDATIEGMNIATPIMGRTAAPQIAGAERTYAVEGSDARATVEDRLARDDMTGMPAPAAVTLVLGGTAMKGTGGDPAALLQGVLWKATEVAGSPVPAGMEVTLQFLDGGRVAGRSACNRYFGGFTLSGEGLALGQLGGTMMACGEAEMAMEQAFLKALAGVTRFDFDEGGALALYAGDSVAARFAP
ncbi:MAG: META domain-containing protein [Rhodobacteraceae bacterium]|nr:META domain-containing protein [Paracoccaceae bacterium]